MSHNMEKDMERNILILIWEILNDKVKAIIEKFIHGVVLLKRVIWW